MSSDTQDRFVWVDLETTGLSHLTDYVLEIGIRITDLELKEIDAFDVQIWESPTYDMKYRELQTLAQAGKTGPKIVMDMHTKSGLWDSCRAEGLTSVEAERLTADFLEGHGINSSTREPMCGSSVHFDRMMLLENFPKVHDQFGYRNIDISSVKELCRHLNPGLYAQMDKYGPSKQERHRVIDDLVDTANELNWYAGEFLIVDEKLEMDYT